ncbi:MAG: DALR domain-containing protein, partial [Thermodesulfobacteriota bacterium]|nr:DALR domain-containing protein [Thermodesulfobacteriota bacterium]
SSPWGDGRPGWHIECSAMSMKYLGETLDIHGGGLDLVFPHHENEIAQSEAATGKQFVKYWIHNGFVTVDEEKMSKSLGNFFTIREILRHHHTDVLRMLFLTNHYRTPVDFSPQNLKEAKGTIDRLYRLFYDINEIEKDSASRGKAKKRLDDLEKISKKVKSFKERFISAMDDDFNTAAALGYTHDLVRDLNRLISHSEKSGLDHDSYDTLIEGSSVLQEMVGLLGLLHTEPSMYFEEDKKRKLSELNLHEEDILKLIAERDEARKAKNWERADKIRDTLKNMGITLQDSQKGTTFSFIDRG